MNFIENVSPAQPLSPRARAFSGALADYEMRCEIAQWNQIPAYMVKSIAPMGQTLETAVPLSIDGTDTWLDFTLGSLRVMGHTVVSVSKM